MTTLIEAAQKLITCMRHDRIEVGDWPDDSREAYLGLKQAIAQEQKPDGYEDMLNALKDERFSI